MNWKHLLAYIAAASTVVGCGGESDSKAPDINLDVEIVEVVLPSDDITNTPLPIEENFDGALDAPTFFSSGYATLSSDSESDAEANFYHSTAGVFLADGSPDPDPSVWITADDDPHLRLGDGRFTIGQIVSVFAPENADDPRKDTTPGNLPDTSSSWGELDLSSTYTVSFCVVDRSDGGLFQIYVDNNTTSSGSSIHSTSSRVVNEQQSNFTAGQRASFEITDVGTARSFIQLRADSGGWIVIDDLVIENAANPASAQPDCSTKTTLYGATQDGNLPEGVAFTGLPLNIDFSAGKEMFFGTDGTEGFLAISDEITNPFYKAISSNSRILINEEGNLFFGNALWAAGAVSGAASETGVLPAGDIDLSAAYSITVQIETVPTFGGSNGFQVMVDNNTSSSSNSIHGSASRLTNLTSDLAVGTLVINVPGDITMNGVDIGDVPVHRGTENSFIGFRCPSDCGDPNGDPANGIEISSIDIAYTGVAFTPAPPLAPTLTAGDGEIEVSWMPVGGATAYDIGYGTVDDPLDAGTVIIEDETDTSATITGLTNGTEYFVFVRSQNANGNSEFSNNAPDPNPSAVPTAGPPGATPANVSVSSQPERLTVSWDAVDGATEYDVAYNTTDDSASATVIADVADTSATILNLTPGTDYYVFVRASNIAGDGPYSASATGQPAAQPATDTEREWTSGNGEFDEVLYASILANTPPTTSNNNIAEATDVVVNGLHFFTDVGVSGPIRHRGSSNQEFNYNGTSYAGGNSTTTPANGNPAPAIRSYIGVPVESGAAAIISVTHRNSGSPTNGAIVFVGSDGNVLCQANATGGETTTECSLASGHAQTEVRVIYSRENDSGGGMHLSSITRRYPGLDRTWSDDNGGFSEMQYASILTNPPPQSSNNNIVENTNAIVNGLRFFTDVGVSGPIRHRGGSPEFNYNGTSYAGGNSVTTPANGNPAPAIRASIGVPVETGSAVTISVTHRNSGSPTNGAIVFVGSDGNVLCQADATGGETTTNCDLTGGHSQTEVRIIYSRENDSGGGMHVSSIARDYP